MARVMTWGMVAVLWVALPLPTLARGQETNPRGVPTRALNGGELRLEIAARVASQVVVDGVLDEAVWTGSPPAEGFVQAEPDEGMPATERTRVWVAFDEEFIYVAAYCYDE